MPTAMKWSLDCCKRSSLLYSQTMQMVHGKKYSGIFGSLMFTPVGILLVSFGNKHGAIHLKNESWEYWSLLVKGSERTNLGLSYTFKETDFSNTLRDNVIYALPLTSIKSKKKS